MYILSAFSFYSFFVDSLDQLIGSASGKLLNYNLRMLVYKNKTQTKIKHMESRFFSKKWWEII